MRVIVSEKPSMGRAIAVALGINGKGRNYIEGNGTIVTWCIGHLVEALPPDSYDPKLKAWRMDTIPFFPDRFQYAPITNTKDQYDAVAALLNRKDVVDVVNATDAGREGELIFDLVYQQAGCTKPVLRFWTSSLTDDAIRDAYAKMKPASAYTGLRDAARCRQEADWLVGLNCTRAQTLAMRQAGGEGVYSIGRVQTPTLTILVQREQEIVNFQPKDFWTLWGTFGAKKGEYVGKWFRKDADGKEQDRFHDEKDAKGMLLKLSGQPGKVASVSSKTEKKKPELLYDLTALQKEANKRFGMTAERTLEIAQELYEAKLISYPRTNSRHLTEADAKKAPGWIKAIVQGQLIELHPFVADLRKRWPVSLDKRYVNDKEVEDHPALTPTENPARFLAGEQLRIYDLIARRFLAAFFPERVECRTVITTVVAQENFRTTGTVVKELGWSAVDPPGKAAKKAKDGSADVGNSAAAAEDAAGTLPAVAKAEAVAVNSLTTKAGKTTPPKRLSEADLLGAMQTAGKDLDDDELKGAMKDCGLGTPATRANIIEGLIKRGFVERQRNVLQATTKGIDLIRSIRNATLKSPKMTGEWEAKMEVIRRQKATRDEFMQGIREFVTKMVGEIRQQKPRPTANGGGAPTTTGTNAVATHTAAGASAGHNGGNGYQRKVVGKCPKCGSPMHLRDWEGRHYARCSAEADPQCKVSYDTDVGGTPMVTCKACKGPVYVTKSDKKVCVAYGKWQDSEGPGPAGNGVAVGKCPKCASDMTLRSWGKKYYAKCTDANAKQCKLSYDTNKEGKALKTCKFCEGPIYTTKDSGEVCVACGKWQNPKR